jgi:DNA-binding response OmpR family regulator
VLQTLPKPDPPAFVPRTTAERSSVDLIDVLVGLLEYRDPFFRGGSSFVRRLATTIGFELGLDEEELHSLGTAALLRDLGRMAVDGALIAPFSASPGAQEREQIERHVVTGLELLAGIPLPVGARETIRHHHENWDGTGYPDRLSGERIPIAARILTVADAMGAMLSPRPYRPPKRPAEALREVQEGAGTMYDPRVVDALVGVLRTFEPAETGFSLHSHLLLVHGVTARAVTLAVHLGSHGFLVDVAATLDAARERLARLPFHAILIAADAPGDPAAVVAGLRTDPRFQALPVLAVDASTTARRLELIQAGFDACFAEDAAPGEIVATMHAFLRRTAVLRRYLDPLGDELQELADAAQTVPRIKPVAQATAAPVALYALQGSVREFPLVWLLQAMQYDGRTALVHVARGNEEGVVALEGGRLRHAEVGQVRGAAAFSELLGWPDGSFRVQPDTWGGEVSITTPMMHLILEHARLQDEGQPIFGSVGAA